ncbi:hypothetical protein K7G19_07425 [Cupriavidus sp. DB3]|uniref:hypothetical protein n=1 Tax=Cupriavidus sp. DB3 TaxID=2873259 RepID=UPI001CF4467C|nr:hypothetical protein [Cupriavidus sp. DB3]MCA7083429.1 hypothetical protein [Cupriavidus sp. DB3]
MKTTVALHRVQDLGRACAAVAAREHLQNAVATYLDLRDEQISAVEDGDTSLASSIGTHMRALREQFHPVHWDREIDRQDD